MAGQLDVRFEILRSLAFGSISGAYAVIGTPASNPGRIIKIVNYTDAPMLISFDGTNDNDFLPERGFALYDFSTNRSLRSGDEFLMSNRTQVFVKDTGSAASTGSVYLTYIYNPA